MSGQAGCKRPRDRTWACALPPPVAASVLCASALTLRVDPDLLCLDLLCWPQAACPPAVFDVLRQDLGVSSLPPPHPSPTPNEVPLPLPLPLNGELRPLLIPTPKPYPQAPPPTPRAGELRALRLAAQLPLPALLLRRPRRRRALRLARILLRLRPPLRRAPRPATPPRRRAAAPPRFSVPSMLQLHACTLQPCELTLTLTPTPP